MTNLGSIEIAYAANLGSIELAHVVNLESIEDKVDSARSLEISCEKAKVKVNCINIDYIDSKSICLVHILLQ